MIQSSKAGLLRWQILDPCGITAIVLVGEPTTEDPHRTSKVFPLEVKQDRLEQFSPVMPAACTMCDSSFITIIDEVGRVVSSVSVPLSESEFESDQVSLLPCSSESSSC